jgi:DNA helicase-2/ATP-dependent DNA helicase PcrA
VINVPTRGIGDKTLGSLQMAARQTGTSPGEILLDLSVRGPDSAHSKTFTGRTAALLADFGALLSGWREAADSMALPALFDRILEDVRYQNYIEDESEEGQERWENVQELRRLAYEYQEKGLTSFLENLALVSDQDTLPERSEAPTLLTLHAAKGLEFSTVFIIGLDENLLPHSRARDDPEELAEERRLFYVGLTRAKNSVYLVRAERRSTFGSFEDSDPSRFIAEIPEGLMRRSAPNFTERREPLRRWDQPARWEGTTLAPKAPPPVRVRTLDQRYKPAMRVRHASWGEGIVINSAIRSGEEEVDIYFETVGFKRVLAAMAKLEVI